MLSLGFEGVYRMGQSRRSWGPFLYLQAVVVGGPWASHEMHARQFHLGEWCIVMLGATKPFKLFSQTQTECVSHIGWGSPCIYICICITATSPLGPKTQDQETDFMLEIIAVFHKSISYIQLELEYIYICKN